MTEHTDRSEWYRQIIEAFEQLPPEARQHWLEALRAVADREEGKATPTQEALLYFRDQWAELAAEIVG